MEKFYRFVRSKMKFILLPLLFVFAALYLIYDIGIMSQGKFLNVLITIVGATVIILLVGAAILSIFLKNEKAQKFIAVSFVTYFILKGVLGLANEDIAMFAQVDDGVFITQAIFQAFAALTLLVIVLFYLVGLFINKFEKLGRFLPFVFLGFIVFEFVAYILLCVNYSRMDAGWYSYIGITATMIVLPLICFFAYLLAAAFGSEEAK